MKRNKLKFYKSTWITLKIMLRDKAKLQKKTVNSKYMCDMCVCVIYVYVST